MDEMICFPLQVADAASFSGLAHTGLLAASHGSPPTHVYYVRFQPGARTHWHVHSGTQLLLVQQGRCEYQRAGGPVEKHPPGSVIRVAPGERHWHGAGPDEPMAHVAINLENEHTEWQEPVTP